VFIEEEEEEEEEEENSNCELCCVRLYLFVCDTKFARSSTGWVFRVERHLPISRALLTKGYEKLE